jgi:Fe-S cluster assembly protein SufD
MIDVTEAKERYRVQFARVEQELARNGQAWTCQLREAAIARFAELGFPTTHLEEWKYTNVAPIVRTPFTPTGDDLDGPTVVRALARAVYQGSHGPRLVFVNGHYAPQFSGIHPLPQGMRLESLATALSGERARVEPYLAHYASYQEHAFAALNTAFMQDGAFLVIPKGALVEEPIHLVFVSTARGEATVAYPRNLILLEPGSQATIVESYVGLEDTVSLTNAVTEIVLGENAVLEHHKLQQESLHGFHVAVMQVSQGRSSQFTSHSIALGGALVRNELNAVLDGEGGECTLDGLYMAAGEQHVDNHTRIDHVTPHCTSRELYKGVLDGRARGVFSGKIYVHPAAQKTDAKQTNKNLLLSRDALIDTKPQLEIHNNDVKCGHGTTIGRLDEDALFYLRARGIGLEAARSLLTYAFASEIVGRIRLEPLAVALNEALQRTGLGTGD